MANILKESDIEGYRQIRNWFILVKKQLREKEIEVHGYQDNEGHKLIQLRGKDISIEIKPNRIGIEVYQKRPRGIKADGKSWDEWVDQAKNEILKDKSEIMADLGYRRDGIVGWTKNRKSMFVAFEKQMRFSVDDTVEEVISLEKALGIKLKRRPKDEIDEIIGDEV